MSNQTTPVILTINVGSSSLKFALYRMRHSTSGVDLILSGTLERIAIVGGRFVARDDRHAVLIERQIELPNYEAAIKAMLDWVNSTPMAETASSGVQGGAWRARVQSASTGYACAAPIAQRVDSSRARSFAARD